MNQPKVGDIVRLGQPDGFPDDIWRHIWLDPNKFNWRLLERDLEVIGVEEHFCGDDCAEYGIDGCTVGASFWFDIKIPDDVLDVMTLFQIEMHKDLTMRLSGLYIAEIKENVNANRLSERTS